MFVAGHCSSIIVTDVVSLVSIICHSILLGSNWDIEEIHERMPIC